MNELTISLFIIAGITCPIGWIAAEIKKSHLFWRLSLGIITTLTSASTLGLYLKVNHAFKQSDNYRYNFFMRAAISNLNTKLKNGKFTQEEEIKQISKSLQQLSETNCYFNSKDLKKMERIQHKFNNSEQNCDKRDLYEKY
ncbi:hypothetical protein AAEX28_01005 [Lentisphaerota bacterium WC36G]|nr:hypothetical protein LJT99_03885 [Lentisphaerae bacterium WC36]